MFPRRSRRPAHKRRAALANAWFSPLARGNRPRPLLCSGGRGVDRRPQSRLALEDASRRSSAPSTSTRLTAARTLLLGLYGVLPARLSSGGRRESQRPAAGRVHEHGNNALRYEVVHVAGEDHAREYEVAVFLLDRQVGSGRGTSKKIAEEAAARAALATLQGE